MPAWSASIPEARRTQLDGFVEQFVDLAMFDGSIVVDVGGEIVYRRSFGLAHYELGVAHTEETRFRIASVSKALTDAAVARLIQKGDLALDTPLERFLPDFPSADAITIGHLLTHRSGIPHSNRQPWGDGKRSLTLDEIVELLAELPLDFEPGSDSGYSNGGYAVLAKVLEIVSGRSFGSAMEEILFRPLGMKDSGHIADARRPIPGIATGYEPGRTPGERRHSRFYAVETRPGGGSFYSTTGDLLRFARGVFRDDFVDEAQRESVMGARTDFLSQGRSPGFVAKLYYGAEKDVIVVSLANSYAVPADWARAIVDIATGDPGYRPWPELRRAAGPVAPDSPLLGRYESSRGGRLMTIERSAQGTISLADAASESVTGLVPLQDGSFLQPFYFQRCEQAPETRVITCRMLSGNERYTSELSPLEE